MKTERVSLNKIELGCLKILASEHFSESNYLHFAAFESLGVGRKEIRRAVRSLARKGFAEYGKGLWTDDGPAGAGYCCTQSGYEFMDQRPL